ncbi:MAG: polyketide synthase [Sphaerisporangium sp.]|nr:polyketide synthase [Sphaerisporangium sp.]
MLHLACGLDTRVQRLDRPKMPASGRLGMWVMARIPGFRDIGRILRYRFQGPKKLNHPGISADHHRVG